MFEAHDDYMGNVKSFVGITGQMARGLWNASWCTLISGAVLASCGAAPGGDGTGGSGGAEAGSAAFVNSSSVTFNGTSQYLVNNSAGISAYPFAFSIWVKTNAASAGAIVGLYNSAATNQMYRISMTATGTVTMTAQNTIARTITSTATVNDGNWHQITAVFSSATSRTLYVDAVSQGVSTNSVVFTTLASTLAVGLSSTSAPSLYFTGQMDEPALWSANLAGADVTALYNSGLSKSLMGATGIYSWWRLGDSASDDLAGAGVLIDQVGSRNLSAVSFSGVGPTAGGP